MKHGLNTVRALSQPMGNGRWRVLVSRNGLGAIHIGFLSWNGKSYVAEFPDGSPHEPKDGQDLSWDQAEGVLLLRYLQDENKRTDETIAARTARGE